jgi:ABC-type antimicrobial peptide transport system permease subunit
MQALGGVAFGFLLATAVARSLSTLLFGISPTDPATFVGAATAAIGIAVIATAIPVWGVLQTTPITALRDN